MSQHDTQREMPTLGMGTFRLKGEVAYESVKMALDVGYRHIDTAQIYDNEAEVGKAIADSGIAREELFVTTKVWNSKLSPALFMDSVHESLEKLGLKQVDLLLIHWPSPEEGTEMAVYLKELKRAKELGLTRYIGVSNFTIANLKEALEVLTADEIYTNQVEVHPYLTNQKLREFCQQQGIHITGYMPFAVGKVLSDDTIIKIANQHQRSPAEVVLAWEFAQGMATIPSSTKRKNLESNFASLDLNLSDEEVQAINKLDCSDRQANPGFSPEWDQ
ncbi:2,5-diketo-D-gluconic acid reductase B [Thalassocella blandensis]|nr:2,5-diketo-D-gluconic acid reductase B [Thalassocella blandensis]